MKPNNDFEIRRLPAQELAILLETYCNNGQVNIGDNTIKGNAQFVLRATGLLDESNELTPRGTAFVKLLVDTPLPVKRDGWFDARELVAAEKPL